MGVGVGEATLSSNAYSLIGDAFPRERLATAMGVFNLGVSIGAGTSFIVGGTLVAFIQSRTAISMPVAGAVKSWQAAFIIAGLSGVLIAFLAFTLDDPRRPAPAVNDQSSMREFAKFVKNNRRVLVHEFTGFPLLGLVYYAMFSWAPAFLVRSHGWSVSTRGTEPWRDYAHFRLV